MKIFKWRSENLIIFLLSLIAATANGCELNADLELTWEWQAERAIIGSIAVRIEKLEEVGSGLLAIEKSPSLAAGFPEPITICGAVLTDDKGETLKTYALTLPKQELGKIQVGEIVRLELVDQKTVVNLVR